MQLSLTRVLVLCAGLAACQGPAGEPGERGANGQPGANGVEGPNGPEGRTIVLSVEAKLGFDISPVSIDIDRATDEEVELIGRGSYLVNAIADCDRCHTVQKNDEPKQFLAGGRAFALMSPGTVVYARNLTPDTTGLGLTEDEFVEAMRTGADFDYPGQSLLSMPWVSYRWMTERDLRSIYKYLRSIPPIQNVVPTDEKGPYAALGPVPFPGFYNEGDVLRDLPPDDAPDPSDVLRGLTIQPLETPAAFNLWSPETQSAFARGSYLVNAVANCNRCHTNPRRDLNPGPTLYRINTAAYLSGGRVFDIPDGLDEELGQARTMASNLTGTDAGFQENFPTYLTIMTQGRRVHEDSERLGMPMPWEKYRHMKLTDLIAIYTYITNVPRRSGAADKLTQPPARFCADDGDCRILMGETCYQATAECVAGPCVLDFDCGACQTCSNQNTCLPPAANSACLTQGI